MTVTVKIDGWPFLVEFTGRLEAERMFDGETVAFRGGVKSVVLDEKTLAEAREAVAKVHAETREFIRFFQTSYGGSWSG